MLYCMSLHTLSAQRGQNRASDPLELEFVWVLGIESSALNTESFLQPKYFFKIDSVSFQCGGLQAWLFVRNKRSGSQA